MPIKNLITRIPRAGIIRLGSQKGTNSPGRNLSYFRLESNVFEMDDLDKTFGKEPKELRIKFPRIDKNDDSKSLEFIFDASYKAYKGGSLFCRGDGEVATRAIAKGKLEQVACTCEYLTGKNPICKQRGDLKVILCQLPFMGYFALGTSSWNSINSIQNVIEMYYQVLGEKFWITEFTLFKEETFLKGHKQYLLKLKVASDFITHLPRGSEVNAVMMFEDESEDTAPEMPEIPSGDTNQEGETHEPEPEPTAGLPNTDDSSADTAEPVLAPDVRDTREPDGTAEAPPASEPEPAPFPDAASAEADPPVEQEVPVQTPPVQRTLTPQRRSKEVQLKQLCKRFAKLGNEKGMNNWLAGNNDPKDFKPGFNEEDPEAVLKFFTSGKGFADIEDDKMQSVFALVNEGITQLETVSDEEIPF